MMLNNRYEDYTSFDAHKAMEDTLMSACHRNIQNLDAIDAKPLPDDLECISQAYLSDVLSFISSCTQEMLFCCSVVFSPSQNRFPSSESLKRISKDQLSYTIGSRLGFDDNIYSLGDDDRERLTSTVSEYVSKELAKRDFIVSATSTDGIYRIFISWGLDKEAAGYIFHITDYSQIDAIKSGVPASDVFV